MRHHLLLLALLPIIGGWTFGQASADEVRIYRDGWGVPHIYGATASSTVHGLGYAQARDRLSSILKNYLTATGQMAGTFGSEYIDQDFRQRLWRHAEISRAGLKQLDPELLVLLRSYISGIRRYMAENARTLPEWAFEPEPYHILALARYRTWKDAEAEAQREMARLPAETDPSNHWVVSKERSAENAVYLLADPHQEWARDTGWYEYHLHGGHLEFFGFTVPGLPFPLFGHNSYLGWSALSGGSDGADVYEVTFRSADSITYKYGSGWKSAVGDTVLIQVMVNGKSETHLRRTLHTVHGPVIERNGRTGYVFRISIADEFRQVEQLYRQITASSLQSFYDALRLAQLAPQRVIYGDVKGNTFYIRTGRIPLRQEVYQWDRPLPGDAPAALWTEDHSQDDLIQAINPPQGWLQDCGTSPDLLMPYSPVTPDRYAAYIYNTVPGKESGRSFRSRQLLSSNTKMTLQEAIGLSQDTYVVHSDKWIRAVGIAINGKPSSWENTNPEIVKAMNLLTAWDGRAEKNRTGITLYARWRQFCEGKLIDSRGIVSNQSLGPETRKGLVEALGEAAEDMINRDGRLEVPWGEIHRIRMSRKSWGVSGSSGPGLESLRVIETTPDLAMHYGKGGQSATTLMVFRGPGNVASYSSVPFGHSRDSSSHHSWDQAEALFSQSRLKPNNFGRKAGLVLQHTLEIPQD
jgi:acyl-homoserine-lactone acylase